METGNQGKNSKINPELIKIGRKKMGDAIDEMRAEVNSTKPISTKRRIIESVSCSLIATLIYVGASWMVGK